MEANKTDHTQIVECCFLTHRVMGPEGLLEVIESNSLTTMSAPGGYNEWLKQYLAIVSVQ